MKGYKLTIIMCAIAAGIILFACSKSSDGGDGPDGSSGNDEFKKNMLINYADNIIIPAYTDLQSKLVLLEGSINTFLAAPSGAAQQTLKTSFKTAWLSYENISVAYFGPASALLLNNYLNTFPAVATKIESGIQSGTYNFALPVASDSIQGFPALDYLLFSTGAVQQFSDAGAVNRKKYVQDVIVRMKSLVGDALGQWNGAYRTTFINSLKTNVGSSIGSLVNQFAFEMDALKGPRIGWPFGKQSNGIVFADKCEGYYAGFSAALAVANLTSLKNYYTGGAGDGIADYLVLLKKNQLNTDVLAQFDIALNALEAIPEPMSAAFTNNATVIETAYKEVQKLLTLLKTDVASATAVQITYMDNDGD
jgi:predicted lipoprotein